MNGMLEAHEHHHPEGYNFPHTLELIRMICDRQQHQELIKEDQVAVSKGISESAVKNYRKIFNLCNFDASAELSVSTNELISICSTVIKMTPEVQAELRSIMEQMSKSSNKRRSSERNQAL